MGWTSSLRALGCTIAIAVGLGCSGSSNGEGPCFVPGESCGATACGAYGYCAASDGGADAGSCLSKRVEGATCAENKECASEQCAGGVCVNGSVPACAR